MERDEPFLDSPLPLGKVMHAECDGIGYRPCPPINAVPAHKMRSGRNTHEDYSECPAIAVADFIGRLGYQFRASNNVMLRDTENEGLGLRPRYIGGPAH
jgi:hypothetical protein